jgi:hypothetical protein
MENIIQYKLRSLKILIEVEIDIYDKWNETLIKLFL